MNNAIRSFFGLIRVTEDGDKIKIEGISYETVKKYVSKKWGRMGSALAQASALGNHAFTFDKFFAVEFLYVFNELSRVADKSSHRSAFLKAIKLMEENTWLKETLREHPPVLDLSQVSKIRKKPLPHQWDFLKRLNDFLPHYNLKGYALASKPGSGKTLASLMASLCWKADVTIIFSPNNAIYDTWQSTILSEVKSSNRVWVSKDSSSPPKGCDYYVIHREAMDRLYELYHDLAKRGKRVCFIIDECHDFNNIEAARTKVLVKTCQMFDKRLVLWVSGTPVKAMGSEVIPMLRTIDDYFTVSAEEAFKYIYGSKRTDAIEILSHRMGLIMFEATPPELAKTNPDFFPVPVELSNGEKYTLESVKAEMVKFVKERVEFYSEHGDEFIEDYLRFLEHFQKTRRTDAEIDEFMLYVHNAELIRDAYDPVAHKAIAKMCSLYEKEIIEPWLNDKDRKRFRESKSVYKYVNLKIQGECLGRVVGGMRIACAVDIARQVPVENLINNSVKKTIIFTSYVEVVELLGKTLTEKGFSPILVYGKTNKDIDASIAAFRNNEKMNPIVATYDSLSTAIHLVEASTVVAMNVPFRSYEFEQAWRRAARIGQDTPVDVFMFQLDTGNVPNISTRSFDIMKWSQEQVDAIMQKVIVKQNVKIDTKVLALKKKTPLSGRW